MTVPIHICIRCGDEYHNDGNQKGYYCEDCRPE